MIETVSTVTHAPVQGDDGMGEYRAELQRGVNAFSSFAAGFSFVSIMTTVTEFFLIGFGFSGSSFIWTWPVIFAGQLLVALCFAEMSARYPISGAIYQWSSRLGGVTLGWFSGVLMVLAQTLATATVAIALQAILPQIWSGFQVVGGAAAQSSPTSPTGASNAVVLGALLICATTAVSALDVKIMSLVNTVGVTVELVGVVSVVVMFFAHARRGVEVLMHSAGATSPHPSSWGTIAASGLVAAYVLVGFDAAGEFSEETHAPRRTTPRTILRALVSSGILGMLMLVGTVLAAPSLTDGSLVTIGMPAVISAVFGDAGSKIILVVIAVAVFSCTLAIQTAGSRMVFSMAREGALPFSGRLRRVNDRSATPVAATVTVGVVAIVVLLINLKQSALFTALGSVDIAIFYLAYLGVTAPLLVQRIRDKRARINRGGSDEFGQPLFSLGRWGTVINVLAVVFQGVMVVNLLWPRVAIYDLTGHTWWLRWSGLLMVGGCFIVVSMIYRARKAANAIPSLAFFPESAE